MKTFKKLFYAFTCAALALAVLGVQPARAAGLVVNSAADTIANDGFCTLREAITNANGNSQLYSSAGECAAGSGADAITFAADYTITLVGSQLPVITSEITITGNGAANTILQAHALPNTATYRVLEISAAGNLTLDGVTVRNGKGFLGGGILNWGTATITASTLNGNTATFDGGGISNFGTATITASTLSGNTAGNYGGGIYNWGTATITASTLSSNTADYNGGGIYNDGTATITASTLNGNTANFGGGIYNYGTATITASTISGNTANEGGGISNRASLSVANSTLVGNSATTGGGGAILSGNSGTATLTNVTISGNASASQAAVWNESGTLHLTNTIIANSTGAADCKNDATLGTNVNNLVEDNTCFPALSGDPLLAPLADNGGDTQTLALLAGSPAIDAGTNVGCPATDQRGVARPQNGTCDIGAYEFEGYVVTFDANGGTGSMSPQVASAPTALTPNAFTRTGYNFLNWNTAADGSGTTYADGATYPFAADATLYAQWVVGIIVNSADDTIVNDGFCTLREAITNANADDQSGSTDCAAGSGADVITFAADYTITLVGSQLPVVTSEITITGNGAANTIIQAHANPNVATYRVLRISAAGNLTLDGVTVRNGKALEGGGIYNEGTATISASTLSGNTADDSGGGISNFGTATIAASTLSGNTATFGGGGISNRASLSVTNSTLAENTATSAGGGAIESGNFGTATLINVTISGNASASQAAVWNESGTLHLTNTLIANSTGAADCKNDDTLGTNANNLVEDNTCSPALSGDPMLGPLANNGGDTQTLALLAGSPAIDAGTNVDCPATDQRGVARPQNGTCDIGAYEVLDITPPTVVTTSLLASYTAPGPNNFTVTFSENVADYAGNANPNDVTNPLNYMVVEDGADSVFNTVSCAGGLAGDDTQATITGVTYNAALYTSTVTLSAALPVGAYRLFVCGTTSIEDPSFNELNGGLSDYTFNFVVAVPASVTNASSLPKTGFAPNKITTLPAQPAEFAYSAMGDLWLEIPALKVKSTIVGVPQAKDKTWNVDWLGNNAGWLNGSAFPTWNGNSVLTAHVTNADGLAGPFANLKELKYGDRIIVHLFGQQYIYEVRETRVERPYATSYAFKSLQDHAYLTLITCQGYNASDDSYAYRRIVRAVLVEVK